MTAKSESLDRCLIFTSFSVSNWIGWLCLDLKRISVKSLLLTLSNILDILSTSISSNQCFPLQIIRDKKILTLLKSKKEIQVISNWSGKNCLELYFSRIFVVSVFIETLLEFPHFIASTELFFGIQFFFRFYSTHQNTINNK